MELYSFYANHGLECALHPALCSAPTNLLPTIGSTWFLTTIPTPPPYISSYDRFRPGASRHAWYMFSSCNRLGRELHATRGDVF